jgi:hypothetical protein
MKKIFFLTAILTTTFSFCQNTFPTNGNVGIGTTNPRANLDMAKDISNSQLGTVFGRLPEGDEIGLGTYLGVKGYTTVGTDLSNVKSFSIVHDFYGQTNNSINFYRGNSFTGGFITFSTANNTEKMRIGTNGNVGIGTTNPSTKLDVNGTISVRGSDNTNLEDRGQFFFENPNHGMRRIGNVVDLFTSGDIESGITFTLRSYNALTNSYINMNQAMKIAFNGNVGIGTTNPTSKLTVAGNINSREVKVTVDAGADFVFEKDYHLPTLPFLESYIKENKHLPEIASAKEMQANGINLSEMNIKLLQKIEEMTLYMIEQEKKSTLQSKKIEEQNKKIQTLIKENESFKTLSERFSKIENQLKINN